MSTAFPVPNLGPDLPGEEQIQLFVDSIPQLAWIAKADGFIFWYNKRWYQYTGATPEAMKGWGWQSVHDPAKLPEVLDRWRESIRTGKPFDMEFPLRAANGEFRWFLTRIVPIRDEDGRLIRWFGTNTDVDDLRRTQEQLRRSESMLRMSQERLRMSQLAGEIGSWELDVDRDQYTLSDEACAILGLTSRSHLTQPEFLSLMYYSADREEVERTLRVAISRNKQYEVQFRIRVKDEDVRWISMRGRPFFNQGRQLLLGILVDVTQARAAAQSDSSPGTAKGIRPAKKRNSNFTKKRRRR